MAKHFGCSTKLIYTKCYSYGIKLRQRYFSGNEGVLNTAISDLHTAFSNSGSKVGTEALLKIKWKFAVHGCIDGYSRLVLYLKCTTSMTAETVVSFFANAVVEFGLPSRVRSDFGYENLFVAMIMNAIRGLSRGSHLTGRSVHNQRIERLWVDVYTQVIDYFYNEFYNLEYDGLLNIENEKNIFALHKVYLPYINEKLTLFVNAWNVHKIRTAKSQTPKQLWLYGMLENINSNLTAISEIFSEQQDLYSRIINALGIEEVNENAISVPDINSHLTVQLDLTEEDEDAIKEVLSSPLNNKQKYTEIVELLNRN
ncbi:hypothetical protein FQR65_LT16860 [Abscondita terminalis]|nr:hypothetical protein FQR65_LT16860 [Abscondita terminalis]